MPFPDLQVHIEDIVAWVRADSDGEVQPSLLRS